jgi:hypothetical protein
MEEKMERHTVTFRQRITPEAVGHWLKRLLIVALVILGAWAVYNGYDFGMGLR